MKILDRYLGRTFLRCWFSVNLILAGLFTFLEFARQVDDIGKGRYTLGDSMLYVVLTLPGRMIDLTPTSALLGSILALGLLSKHHELLAIRAGGVSIQYVGLAFVRPAFLTLVGLLLASQFAIPSLEQTAWILRETALSKSGTLLPSGGFWARDGKRFVNLRTAPEDGARAVDIYEFDDTGGITYTHAQETEIGADGVWRLHDVKQREVSRQETRATEMPELDVPDLLTREQATALILPPQTLSLSELLGVMGNLESRGQNPGRYRLALWQKMNLPVMAAAMIMMSLPFVCGPTRSANLGWRFMIGAIVGVAFFFLNQILGYTGLILQLSPFWTTLFPALLLLGGGVWLTRRLV